MLIALTSCANQAPSTTEKTAAAQKPAAAARKHLLDRVDDTAIVQLYADGFDELAKDDKLLCWHLYQAAVAGRDIYLDQRFAKNLAIRDLLEELWRHRAALEAPDRAEVERYTKLFWVHNGIHHNLSTRKMLLGLDAARFARVVERARQDGARLAGKAELDGLHAVLTDPATFAAVTDKSPGEGKDPIAESCNNMYVGVTSADLRGFVEKNGLNSRLVKGPDGKLEEQVYRAGDGKKIPPGRYAAQIAKIIEHLRAAQAYAPAKTRKALDMLVQFYETGENEDWRKWAVAWVQDNNSVVDNVNGFVEVYVDARGIKGAWEAIVSFKNPEKTKTIEKLAEMAPWFEQRMPWPDEFKKKDVKGISARAITVLVETGDSGPITPVGINLPNEEDIREKHGSKSVNLSNVVEAYENSKTPGALAEFCGSPEEVARGERWAAESGDMHTNLHEVIGHASGQARPEVKSPAQVLGTYYSTLEEARADLVGLYWISDPELLARGLVPHTDMALAEYEAYARNALAQLRRVPKGGKLEEDHMRNRQLIVHWLIANSDAIKVETRQGKTYYRVTSVGAFQRGCGRLLAEVMRIKATGDFKAGKKLVDEHGTKVDPKLHEEVLARIAQLGLPSITGFVQPELRAVTDSAGNVIDVKVEHPCDLAAQMLRWSGRGE
jgi:dipeptidyl-peptidase-3